MQHEPTARAGTALSPEWDRGFDEEFAELISGDDDLVRAEFDALIGAVWDDDPPQPPSPPAPATSGPTGPLSGAAGSEQRPVPAAEQAATTESSPPESPP